MINNGIIREETEKKIKKFCLDNKIEIKDVFIISKRIIEESNNQIPTKTVSLEEKYEILEEVKTTIEFFSLKKMVRKANAFLSIGFKLFETPKELISKKSEETFIPIVLKVDMDLNEINEIIEKHKFLNVNFWENLFFIASNKKMRKERIFSLGSAFKNYELKDIQHGATFIPAIVKSECIFRPIISNDLKLFKFSAGDIILFKKS